MITEDVSAVTERIALEDRIGAWPGRWPRYTTRTQRILRVACPTCGSVRSKRCHRIGAAESAIVAFHQGRIASAKRAAARHDLKAYRAVMAKAVESDAAARLPQKATAGQRYVCTYGNDATVTYEFDGAHWAKLPAGATP